jgi:hypothetical protein
MDIKTAVSTIFSIANIKAKDDLDRWCGEMGRQRLYLQVERLAPQDWERLRTPKESVRACYERLLPGYKLYHNE